MIKRVVTILVSGSHRYVMAEGGSVISRWTNTRVCACTAHASIYHGKQVSITLLCVTINTKEINLLAISCS